MSTTPENKPDTSVNGNKQPSTENQPYKTAGQPDTKTAAPPAKGAEPQKPYTAPIKN
jgi:hypothetical protein